MKISNNVQKILNKIENKFHLFKGYQRYIHIPLHDDFAVSNELLYHSLEYKINEHKWWPYYQFSHNLAPPNNYKHYIEICPYIYQLAFYLNAWGIALTTWYNEGGYVSWHNNADVPGRNLLFCWSEDGNGVFRTYNEKTDTFTDFNDKPGWSVRSTVFYSENDSIEKSHSWHAMHTNCCRFSLAFRILESPTTNDVLSELDLI